MKMNKKGFTLIEMLVVIAIIAVLVSIIIPTVSSATDKAGAAANAANLRSVYAELMTDTLAGVADDKGYVRVTDAGVVSLATGDDAPPASAKTVGIEKNVAMELITVTDATTKETEYVGVSYGAGFDIEYFSAVAETGKAPSND